MTEYDRHGLVPRELLSETTSRYAANRVDYVSTGEHQLLYDFPNRYGVQVSWFDTGSREFAYDVVLRDAGGPPHRWGSGWLLCHAALSPRMVEEALLFARALPAAVDVSVLDAWRSWKPSHAAHVEQVREGTQIAKQWVAAPESEASPLGP